MVSNSFLGLNVRLRDVTHVEVTRANFLTGDLHGFQPGDLMFRERHAESVARYKRNKATLVAW